MENYPSQNPTDGIDDTSSMEENKVDKTNIDNEKSLKGTLIGIIILLIIGFVGYIAYNLYFHNEFFNHQSVLQSRPPTSVLKTQKTTETNIKKFKSEEEFKAYLEETNNDSQNAMYGSSMGMRNMATMDMAEGSAMMKMEAAVPTMAGSEEQSAGRVSDTNTQVLAIDEPDIVKTDGEDIYYAKSRYYYGYRDFGGYRNQEAEVKIIKAFPPAELEEIASIDKSGDLFLHEDTLVVFSGKNIYGYDVSDSQNPSEEWKLELGDNNRLMEARLYKGEIYLVTRNYIDTYKPCPIRPFAEGGNNLEIGCADIYYPSIPVETDSTFIALKIDAESGEIKDKASFIGSSNSSVIYMSEEAIYITYFYNKDNLEFFHGFLSEKCSDLVPNSLIVSLDKLNSYDISNQAKMVEMQVLLEKFYAGLDNDEKLRIENEFSNRMSEYHKEHVRELERTGIVKIGLENFEVDANGEVPGYPLNQFALDEYEGNLRMATTVGERTGSFYFIGRGESLNDVYILDKDLKEKGSVLNLGETERVYSVRFVGEMAYVVTFRQTDPFYVLDLSDPSNPELKGELKIPGYSSYLHPLSKDAILGIGKEGSKVKLSLFDVSDPTDPQEVSKYMLDEYWSEAVNNHHAFLLDKKHEVFFIPGGKGAYVFSYVDNKISLTKAISKTGIKRAIYLDDYLYIIGSEEISVINENDWTEVNKLELNDIDGDLEPALEKEVMIQKMEIFAE
jgi:inhibitor of cysteine peptidase